MLRSGDRLRIMTPQAYHVMRVKEQNPILDAATPTENPPKIPDAK